MTNKQTPFAGALLAMVSLLTFSSLGHAASSLGEINIELRGNVVDFTCAVIASDSWGPGQQSSFRPAEIPLNRSRLR